MAERRTMFECEECKRWFFSMEIFVRHPCVMQVEEQAQPNNGIEDNPTPIMGIQLNESQSEHGDTDEAIKSQYHEQLKQEEMLSWSPEATRLFLCEYNKRQRSVDSGKLKKKAFEEVSSVLNGYGYHFNGEQCATRLKTLLRGYKLVKDHNAKSGNQRKTHQYEKELYNIMGDKPNIKPVYTLSTAPIEDEIEAEQVEVGVKRNRKEQEDEGKSTPKVRKTNQMSDVLTFLKDQAEEKEKRRVADNQQKENRHKERMTLMREFINVVKESK